MHIISQAIPTTDRQGPAYAIRLALQHFQLSMPRAYVLTLPDGGEIDLTFVSPTALKQWLWRRHEDILLREATHYLSDRAPLAFASSILPALHQILLHKQETGIAQLLLFLAGTLPTPYWLSTHGFDCEATCPYCRGKAHIWHGLAGCDLITQEHAACSASAALCSLPTPPVPHTAEAVPLNRKCVGIIGIESKTRGDYWH
jgi:hypothetical protein